tara:strand:+ start:106696 stop:108030 length:1335 start_codon:yes stop_codon:yes gene_type:complete
MNTTIEEINETRKDVIVSVSADEIAAAEEALIKDFAKKAKVPGFRPGKASESVIKSRFSKEIANELGRKLIEQAYESLLKDEKLSVYAVLNAQPDNLEKGKEGTIRFTLDIRPEFDLPEYKQIPITLPIVEVTEEDVDKAIDEVRQQRADFKVTDRAAQKGDYVKLSYTGTLDGQPVAELVKDHPIYGTQTTTWEEAAAQDSPGVQAVVDALVGMKAEDKKTVTMEFAQDFAVEPLAGKSVEYAVEVFEVREKVLPEINEEFLKSLQVENEADLRERIKQDFTRRQEQESQGQKRQQIMDFLVEKTSFALPESAVENQTEMFLRDFIEQNMNLGVPQEEFEKRKEELFEQARSAAEKRVQVEFITQKVAEAEKIEISNQDLSQALMQEAMMTRTKPEDLINQVKKNQAYLQQLQRNALFNKTLDFLIEEAMVTYEENAEKAASS